MKKVSVIIPAYNKADLTVKSVESVLEQTYGDIEIIVVDDGSTDETKSALSPYFGKIKYLYKENGGASSARNLGIQQATGEYIAFLDCDDVYFSEKIERCVGYLETNPKFGFVHTPVYFIDEKGEILGKYPRLKKSPSGHIAKKLLSKNFVCNSTPLVRKSCFEKAGLFDETIFTPADWDMWIRLAERYKAGCVNIPLTGYRKSESYIAGHLEQSKKEMLRVLEKAFKRNPDLNERDRKKLISNVCYWQALGYLRAGDFQKAKREIKESLGEHKFNIKVLILLCAVTVFRERVSALLS